jgi:hypothetical protein
VDVNYCASDDFVRGRNKEGVEKVVGWIKHSGYDLTRPLRAEMGLASEGNLQLFKEEGCIPATASDIVVMFRVFDGAHRLAACRQLQGRRCLHH